MKKPVILFIPVSSTKGIGEYTRSVILAEALKTKIPTADIHFILNRHIEYGNSCPFPIHFSDHSATKDTPKVKNVLLSLKPDLVIFDCAGRANQFSFAKSVGAKVIFISQHKRKRARGLKIRRLLNSDLHWVVQPPYAISPLSYLERLKLKLLGKKHPRNIGPILPAINRQNSQQVLDKFGLSSNQFFIFSAGSGGHKKDGELVADQFNQAAMDFYDKTNIKCIMVFGPNYVREIPKSQSVICVEHLPNTEFMVLLNEAQGRVVSAGDTLLQIINLQKPSVATAVSKDQPARLLACSQLGLTIKSDNDPASLVENAVKLLDLSIGHEIVKNIKKIQPDSGLDVAISEIYELLDINNRSTSVAKTLAIEDSEVRIQSRKKYLFFVSQDYSFPILRPLQDEILSGGDQVKWFVYGPEVREEYLLPSESRIVNIDDIIEYQPDAVFVPGNVVPSFIPGLKIQVFHGLPSTKAKKSGQLYHYIIRGMFDLYCTQGPSSTDKFTQLQKKYRYFSVQETGWCKLDPLFTKDTRTNRSHQQAIFFASTFSPRFSKAEVLYPLIIEMMKKYDFHWFITLHPKMDHKIVELYKSINLPNVSFVESTELIESFIQSDLMLCDTSSIIYEFMTQQKPVITFQTEKEEPHLINVRNINQLEGKIIEVLGNLKLNRDNIDRSIAQFHPYTDGHSSKRILATVEKMLAGENLPSKKKPLNVIRNYKLRKQLDYWKW